MKKLTFMSAALAASFGLLLTTASAQDTTQPIQNLPAENAIDGKIDPNRTGRQAEKQTNQGQLYQVDDLVGAKIRNAKGEDLGEVEEMVVDVSDGSIRYAVVSYGGFLDLGDKLFAVPLKAMTLQRNEDNENFFVVDIDQKRLEDANGFDDDNWPNLADRDFASATYKTYNVKDDAAASSGKASLYKLSTFDGVNVRGEGNQELGEVKRILIDAKRAQVTYLALELEDEAANAQRDDDSLVLVPMSQFTLKTQDDDTFLHTMISMDKIRSAPTATEEQLNDVSKHRELRQNIDSHFGAVRRGVSVE